MSKGTNTWVPALAMMAPCVFCVGGPLAMLAVAGYKQKRDFEKQYPGSDSSISLGGIGINGNFSIGYVFAGALVILFIAGFILLLRSLNSKHEPND